MYFPGAANTLALKSPPLPALGFLLPTRRLRAIEVHVARCRMTNMIKILTLGIRTLQLVTLGLILFLQLFVRRSMLTCMLSIAIDYGDNKNDRVHRKGRSDV